MLGITIRHCAACELCAYILPMKEHTEQIVVRLPPELLARLKAEADKQDRPLAYVVRVLLDDTLPPIDKVAA